MRTKSDPGALQPSATRRSGCFSRPGCAPESQPGDLPAATKPGDSSWRSLLSVRRRLAAAGGLSLCLFATGFGAAQAASLSLQVRDGGGNPVEDAVVYLMSKHASRLPLKTPTLRIDQIDKTFVPLVSVAQTGTRVSFPNRDNIRHHVYSFSSAKKFEIKLYADTPSRPVVFDRAGVVVMGCNIHDTMIAHLLVVDTPYFGKSDRAGNLRIDDVPPGDYSLIAWDYLRPDRNALTMPLGLKGDTRRTLTLRGPGGD